MNFLEYSLGYRDAGAVAVVTLEGVESDVFLVDDINLQAYKTGGRVEYFGGHYKQSPVRLVVPRAGYWHAVVTPGLGGSVRAGVVVVEPRAGIRT